MQISSFSLIAPLAVGLALSGCTTGQTPLASSEAPPPSAGVSIGQRDLTPEEKKVIMDAVAQSLRNPGSAKYHWAKFPAVVTEGSVNYCATVDAQSPYAAYNGRQAYVVEAQISGNRVSSAVVGLVAGGKDFAIVTNMCAKYGLGSVGNKAAFFCIFGPLPDGGQAQRGGAVHDQLTNGPKER